eukprot:67888_1
MSSQQRHRSRSRSRSRERDDHSNSHRRQYGAAYGQMNHNVMNVYSNHNNRFPQPYSYINPYPTYFPSNFHLLKRPIPSPHPRDPPVYAQSPPSPCPPPRPPPPCPPRAVEPLPLFFCSACGTDKAGSDFSNRQKRKAQNMRRCRVCIESNIISETFRKNERDEVVRVRNNENNHNQSSDNHNNEQNEPNQDSNISSSSFACHWCDQSFTTVEDLAVHCNTAHFPDSNASEQKDQDNQQNQDADHKQEVEMKDDDPVITDKKKKKEYVSLPIDGRWIVYYSDPNDIEGDKDSEYNKLITHRYKMDLETLDIESSNVNGHCVKGSGDYEWRFLLKGALDESNNFVFTMKGRNDTIYGKARFDGKDSLKRGSWYLDKKRKKECGILSAQRDHEYDKHKEDDDTEKVLCIMCMENECCVACIPCGHTSVCRDCVEGVTNSHKCPFCAMPITGVMNIFISGF